MFDAKTSFIYALFMSFGVDLNTTITNNYEMAVFQIACSGVIVMLTLFCKFLFSMVKSFLKGGLY